MTLYAVSAGLLVEVQLGDAGGVDLLLALTLVEKGEK
jgi:hypothetical protein